MAQVKIRDLDNEVVSVLKHRAALRGHSLEQELREILTQAARPDRRAMVVAAQALQKTSRRFGPQVDSVELLREDRER